MADVSVGNCLCDTEHVHMSKVQWSFVQLV